MGKGKNIALILAGGDGLRMKDAKCPKQYMLVKERPIITYALEVFQNHEQIDGIVIVAAEEWRPELNQWIQQLALTKVKAYAKRGITRQHSIYHGLQEVANLIHTDEDVVIIHDAVRPLVTKQIIADCLAGARELGGALPTITVKDTTYKSTDGRTITSLLNRSQLCAGQTPEAFRFKTYFAINQAASDEELASVSGAVELAFRNGMQIRTVNGSESNIKITTREDLTLFYTLLGNQ